MLVSGRVENDLRCVRRKDAPNPGLIANVRDDGHDSEIGIKAAQLLIDVEQRELCTL